MTDSKDSRRVFVGGNWKMTGTARKVADLVDGINKGSFPEDVDAIVAPTCLHLAGVLSTIQSRVKVAAQNVSQYPDGAYTGEISATQLVDAGIPWVIIGHSERRKLYGDSDKVVAEKIVAALKAGLNVIACLGETLEERKAEQTLSVVSRQLEAIAGAVSDWSRVVLAYEPVWAIGTGVVATPDQAQEVHQSLRAALNKSNGEAVAKTTRIIYGGSVKPDNCDSLLTKPDVDGFLVGGASLVAADFVRICNAKSL